MALERAAAKIQGQFRRGRAQQDMKALVKAHHGRLTQSQSQAAAEATQQEEKATQQEWWRQEKELEKELEKEELEESRTSLMS